LSVFLEGASVYGAFAFIASHLHRVYGMSLSAAGSLVMLFRVCGVSAVRRGLGAAGTTPGRSRPDRWAWELGAGILARHRSGAGVVVAVPGCFVAGLGCYMLHSTLQTNATQMAPERRARCGSRRSRRAFFSPVRRGRSWQACGRTAYGTAVVIALGGLGVVRRGHQFQPLRSRSLRRLQATVD